MVTITSHTPLANYTASDLHDYHGRLPHASKVMDYYQPDHTCKDNTVT